MIDDRFTAPRSETIAALRACPGDVIVLGAGGKMGPSLSAMLARATGDGRRITAVSRWTDRAAEADLQRAGVKTLACDLLDPRAVAKLPDAPNVIFMAGQKFGTQDQPARTWAMNALVPAYAAARYAGARIVAFSTGNVYPLVPPASGGAREGSPLGPVGEYAASCVGRERVFEHFADRDGTRVAIVRLNYAIDVRYGVLLDLAKRVTKNEAIPIGMGFVNVIWQGDANRIAIECLPHASTPPFIVNVTGPETLLVRSLAIKLGERLGKKPIFEGEEKPDALLSNTDRMRQIFAAPAVGIDEMIEHVAAAVLANAPTLGKPTHFEARDGRF